MFEWLYIDWRPDKNDANHSPIERGFWLCFMDDYSRAMQSFLQRWGNMEQHTFLNILLDSEKHDDDTVVAICVLAWEQFTQARQLLRPFLQSDYPKERWCSALCLSELGDEQAVPVLCTMLGEFYPFKNLGFPRVHEQAWYEDRRWFIPCILRRWAFPYVTVALRQALEQQIEAERIVVPEEICIFMQDILTYELGSRDAFGILAGFTVSAYHFRLIIVHLAVGWYETQISPKSTYGMNSCMEIVEKRDLRATLNNIVMAKCGLSEMEADQCFEQYFDDTILRLQQAERYTHGEIVGQGEYAENSNIDDVL